MRASPPSSVVSSTKGCSRSRAARRSALFLEGIGGIERFGSLIRKQRGDARVDIGEGVCRALPFKRGLGGARVRMFAGDIPRRDQPLPRFIDDADEVEGVQGIDEKQLERVRADLSEYGQVGVGWADPGKERAEPLTLRPR